MVYKPFFEIFFRILLAPGNRDSDQMRFAQLQFDNVKQESARIDEQIATMNHQYKHYQNQMEVSHGIFFNILIYKSSIFTATSSSTSSTWTRC